MKTFMLAAFLLLIFTPNITLSKSIEKGLFLPRLMERRACYEEIVSVTDEEEKKVLKETLARLLEKCIQDKNVDKSFEGPLHLIIKALGELQTKEAIPIMLEYFIFVPDDYVIEESINTQWYYPVAVALIKIGDPSIVYMQKVICDEIKLKDKKRNAELHSDEAKQLAAWVMMDIMGKEKALEKLQILENESRSCPLKDGRKVSDYIRNFKLTFHNPREKRLKDAEQVSKEEEN